MNYILEITDSQLRSIAKGLHLLLADDPKDEDAAEALSTLTLQSDCVFKKPENHGIFTNGLSAPVGSELFAPVYHMPIRKSG